MIASAAILGLFALQAISAHIDSISQSFTIDSEDTDSQTIHHVTVGHENAPVFVPSRLNANVGDKIQFKFGSVNHTLTESSLENPCTPVSKFDTGFNQFNPQDRSDPILTITVNSLEPRWFFCRQNNPFSHCHKGMVFALNPGDEMKDFLDNAKRDSSGSSAFAYPTPSTPVSNSVRFTRLCCYPCLYLSLYICCYYIFFQSYFRHPN
ncbi:hypothetical protein EYZ11_006930 [Aspergillus tanneri]|uniref:Phytocyanin domain-containing protein n=1 Tax=Aspergillus tanneri TaxID=1220188 RepID=A0A4S3JGG8_9EURO|nr:hypothetical protein EYZ11_006930 [Aspergillus tanneri]